MAESHDAGDNGNSNPSFSDVDLDSDESVLNAFLQYFQAKPTSVEDWYTIPGNFDQLLENFQASHPQIWEALPSNLRFEIYQDRELHLPMAPPCPEHNETAREMIRLLLDKLQTLRKQPATSLVVQSFVTTIQNRGEDAILLDINSKLCPDQQLASIYDCSSPLIIEVACSQKFYGDKGLKWKLDREIVDSLGNIKVGLGLKISINQTGWNPHLTLYRPLYQGNPTGTGGTLEVEEIFEQIPLTDPNGSSQVLGLILGDLISQQAGPTIFAQFPGLQEELDLPIPITLGEVATAIATAKANIDTRNQTLVAAGQSAGSNFVTTKRYVDNRNPGLAW